MQNHPMFYETEAGRNGFSDLVLGNINNPVSIVCPQLESDWAVRSVLSLGFYYNCQVRGRRA